MHFFLGWLFPGSFPRLLPAAELSELSQVTLPTLFPFLLLSFCAWG